MFLATTPLSVTRYPGIVLLGPWCLEGHLRGDLEKNHLVSYRLATLEEKIAANKEVSQIVENLLPLLARQLNAFHGKNYSDRYWRIICGRWLLGFVDVLYQRWNLIDEALDQFPIDRAGGSEVDHSEIAPRRSQDLATQRISHDWNDRVFTIILKDRQITIENSRKHSANNATHFVKESHTYKKAALALWGLMSKKSSLCIADSYFDRTPELFLALRNYSLPVRLTRTVSSNSQYSEFEREKLRLSLPKGGPFVRFLFENIHRWLPFSWVEDFAELATGSIIRQLPVNPHTIFTANAHHASDYFMIYMASQSERGARIVLAQHGGLYGEGEVRSRNEEHELAIADTYVTWGWKDSKYNNIVNCRSQIRRLKSSKTAPREGGLLFVMDATFRYSRYSWETRPERELYLNSCARVCSQLPSTIRSRTVIRLHHDHDLCDTGHQDYFEKCSEVAFDDYSRSISRSIAASRLVIVTTLSTTFIENITQGIPTLIFAQPEIYEVRTEYRDIFDELARAGIFHESPDSVARWATSIWDGVEGWWNSESVQAAVHLYGQHFAGFPTEARRTWQQILSRSGTKG